MKAFWGDFALVDNLEKASWKISEKKSYFQKNYASSKAKELKALLNLVPVLLCIINVFPFNERLNSKCFLSFQQNSIYQMQYSLFIPAILKKFLSVSSSNMQQCFKKTRLQSLSFTMSKQYKFEGTLLHNSFNAWSFATLRHCWCFRSVRLKWLSRKSTCSCIA